VSVLQVSVTTADHIQADPQAPVTLVEYGDYECPGCGAAYPIVKAVWGHFDKRLRFVFRNFPLTPGPSSRRERRRNRGVRWRARPVLGDA
jgi:protein-disulfide isomerase